MKKYKKIKVFSLVRFQTIMGALIGLILGIVYAFGGLIIDALVTIGVVTTSETPGLSYGTVLAFGALIGMPMIFATVGCIVGLCEAILYNLCARWIGGIKIECEGE